MFTPDEEVGHGVDNVDMKNSGLIGYTIDGADLGSIQNETFSADLRFFKFKITGFNIHPGFAKDK